MSNQLPLLIIMAKQPLAGQSKTRLCPPLSHAASAAVAEAMLLDTLDLVQRVPGVQPALAFAPPGSAAYFAALDPTLHLIDQGEGGLGERLAHVTTTAFAEGAPAVAVLASDNPSVPAAYLSRAFRLLDTYDLVLGPSEDGGYYLAALRSPAPEVFTRVPMSCPDTFATTLAVAAELGLQVARLPSWYDVDTAADLRRLAADLAPLPHVRTVLASLHT